MKKIVVFLLFAILLSSLVILIKSQIKNPDNQSEIVSNEEQNDLQYRFLISTDLHFLSQSLTDNGEKFAEIIKKGDGKVMLYIEDLIDEFFNQVILQKPDALILTGDITFNGELISNEEMAQKLKGVKDAGIDIFVLPGNHDVYTECYSFKGDGYFETQTTDSEEFYRLYADFGYNQAIAKDETSASYIAELLPDLWLVMLDTTSKYYNVLPPETMEWLEEKLVYAQNNKIRVISASHQNLISHNKMFETRFLIKNSTEIVSLLKQYNVLCNFSGHIHIQHIAEEAEFYEIVTGALSVCENNYGEVHIKERTLNYYVKNVERFSKQSKDFFYETDLNKRMNGQEDIEISKLVANVNTEYFAGKLNKMPKSILDKLDKEKSGFSSNYFDSLHEEVKRDFDNRELEIVFR